MEKLFFQVDFLKYRDKYAAFLFPEYGLTDIKNGNMKWNEHRAFKENRFNEKVSVKSTGGKKKEEKMCN